MAPHSTRSSKSPQIDPADTAHVREGTAMDAEKCSMDEPSTAATEASGNKVVVGQKVIKLKTLLVETNVTVAVMPLMRQGRMGLTEQSLVAQERRGKRRRGNAGGSKGLVRGMSSLTSPEIKNMFDRKVGRIVLGLKNPVEKHVADRLMRS